MSSHRARMERSHHFNFRSVSLFAHHKCIWDGDSSAALVLSQFGARSDGGKRRDPCVIICRYLLYQRGRQHPNALVKKRCTQRLRARLWRRSDSVSVQLYTATRFRSTQCLDVPRRIGSERSDARCPARPWFWYWPAVVAATGLATRQLSLDA